MRILFFILLLVPMPVIAQPDNVKFLPQVPVYFDLGSDKLTPAAKNTIDSLIYVDALPPGMGVGIIGYADMLGGENANKELSLKRANAVSQYLQSMGVDSSQIEEITGRGEVERPEKTGGYAEDRKVCIVPGGFNKPKKIDWAADGTLIATITFRYTSKIFRPTLSTIQILDTVVDILKKHPRMQVHADGFVCCFNYDDLSRADYSKLIGKRFTDTARLGGAERLSTARAAYVAKYLISKGIAKERIKCRSFGYLKNKLLPDGQSVHSIDRVEIRVARK